MALASSKKALAREHASAASGGLPRARRTQARAEQLAGPRMLTFGFLLGLAFWAAILFALFVGTTFGYQPHGFKWATPDVGFSADAAVAGYTSEGMRQWSAVSALRPSEGGADIRVVVAPLAPPITYDGQPAQANVKSSSGRISSCEVRLDPVHFFALPEAARQNTVTHEIGHCIGLNHSDLPGVMKNPLFYNFSDDDAAGAVNLYGPAGQGGAEQKGADLPAGNQPAPEPPRPGQTEELTDGWNLVVWRESTPVSGCGCSAVYAFRGGTWLKWFPSAPLWLNEIEMLEAGQPYWVLR